jgi:hypothetical protein
MTSWRSLTANGNAGVAAALALGLAMLCEAILPLAAQPVSSAASPAMSKALFLCRAQNGIDQACAAALAKALIIEQSEHGPTQAADRACHLDPRKFPAITRRAGP